MTAPQRQCQTCQHWQAAPDAARGACALGEIDFPWLDNTCARHEAQGTTTKATQMPFDMRQAWGKYIPGAKP